MKPKGEIEPEWKQTGRNSVRCVASTVTADVIDLTRERAKRHAATAGRPNSRHHAAARIYRPARSVMQAGCGNKRWLLEFVPTSPPEIEPLMGWTGSRDTIRHVKLSFPDKESAVAFAERQGWPYAVFEPHEPRARPKSYGDNFRWQGPSMRRAWKQMPKGR